MREIELGAENNKDFSWQLARRGPPSRRCDSQVTFDVVISNPPCTCRSNKQVDDNEIRVVQSNSMTHKIVREYDSVNAQHVGPGLPISIWGRRYNKTSKGQEPSISAKHMAYAHVPFVIENDIQGSLRRASVTYRIGWKNNMKKLKLTVDMLLIWYYSLAVAGVSLTACSFVQMMDRDENCVYLVLKWISSKSSIQMNFKTLV